LTDILYIFQSKKVSKNGTHAHAYKDRHQFIIANTNLKYKPPVIILLYSSLIPYTSTLFRWFIITTKITKTNEKSSFWIVFIWEHFTYCNDVRNCINFKVSSLNNLTLPVHYFVLNNRHNEVGNGKVLFSCVLKCV
jgi:hypothetical protein